ncbi:hypothetical protein RT41_GL000986 [Lactococcus fujiensis JCM 16395]|uniref:Uncharacterized protein n=1 Tax=Lactococcus fujiensis JCM 16395 TaxID=1291764 RepID=A0A2A5RMQ4_9LACT|nr:hypothetical protein RT41_GL000986 [Lactococcus fujiensis JCM 16395]
MKSDKTDTWVIASLPLLETTCLRLSCLSFPIGSWMVNVLSLK